ncbi:MAG: response regulator, partial [Thermodesulfobacteriota bacterium]|nr:response regulator [Thermodesulfobacteriota bacterium]
MENNKDKQKNILIVDDEKYFLLSLKASLETHSSNFNVLMAENGKAAIGILESENIDLIVTDLRMPEMDGFELLAYMSINFPYIPAIVTSAFGTPQIKERLETMGTLRFLEKPIDFHELAKAVTDGLAYDLKSGSLSGISICSFLQLIEIEEKTCLLEVFKEDKDQKGFFYFNTGNLYDAIYRDLKGEDAALEMVSWDNVEIRFKDLPKRRIKNRINRELIALIVDGMRLKDESKYADIDDQYEEDVIEASNEKNSLIKEDTAIYESSDLISESGEEEEHRVTEGLEIFDEKESQKESMAIGETGEKKYKIKEEFSAEEDHDKPSQMENHTNSERKTILPKLNNTLKEMADEVDSYLALLVVSTDGNVIAKHCLTPN